MSHTALLVLGEAPHQEVLIGGADGLEGGAADQLAADLFALDHNLRHLTLLDALHERRVGQVDVRRPRVLLNRHHEGHEDHEGQKGPEEDGASVLVHIRRSSRASALSQQWWTIS
ncbi:hypothetical protein L6R46_19750 [Myxococcota bacterium]|nr:hypothetical protein [Myxococcota bacterium]